MHKVFVYTCVYIYIYMMYHLFHPRMPFEGSKSPAPARYVRDRPSSRRLCQDDVCMYAQVCIYIYIYIYLYIYMRM